MTFQIEDRGKQVNLKQISFRNQAELTMFLIRWQGEKN